MADFTIFRDFCEMGPSSKDFLSKMDPCLRIFAEKVTHLGCTSPYALTCEYPPGAVSPPEHNVESNSDVQW